MSINMFKYFVSEMYNKASYSMEYAEDTGFELRPFNVDPLTSSRDDIEEFIVNAKLLDSEKNKRDLKIGQITVPHGTEESEVPMTIDVFAKKHFFERIMIQRNARRQELNPLKLINSFTGEDLRPSYNMIGLDEIKDLMCKCALKILNVYPHMDSYTEYLLYSNNMSQGVVVMVLYFDEGPWEFYFRTFLPRTATKASSTKPTVVNLNLDNTAEKLIQS
jgi:hypothetical protein